MGEDEFTNLTSDLPTTIAILLIITMTQIQSFNIGMFRRQSIQLHLHGKFIFASVTVPIGEWVPEAGLLKGQT